MTEVLLGQPDATRRQIILPPGEQLERLTADVDQIYQILEGMSKALLHHDQALKEIVAFVTIKFKELNDKQSTTQPNGVEESAVEGDRERGTTSPLPD